MARRRGVPTKSAAVAATLSFILPGAGQAYVRRWGSALLFAVPVVLLLIVVVPELAGGASRLGARLLNPTVAAAVMGGAIVLGVWRIAAVVHAWRQARRNRLGWIVLPVLLALIVGSHGYAFVTAGAMLTASNRIASGGDSLLEPDPSPTPPLFAPGSPSLTPTPTAPAGPSAQPSPTLDPADDDDPYNDDDGPEETPQIDQGPAPEFDISRIDTQTDGLLNVLIAGIDWMPGRDSARTDTMIVVSVNTETNDVYMFSFPRDVSRFPLYTGGTYSGKINTFAGFANRNKEMFPDGGMRSLAHQIGYLLGVPIDYYAAVDIPGFESVVAAIGGVTVYNEKEIADHYINGGRGFFLPVGEHRLNASQALDYVRSRKGSSDFARAHRQQQILSALRREMTKPDKLANLPSIVDAISQVLRTDFPRDRLNDLLALSEKVNDEPSGNYVFRYPEYATFIPRRLTENGKRAQIIFKMDKIAELSLQLFGEKSLYSR